MTKNFSLRALIMSVVTIVLFVACTQKLPISSSSDIDVVAYQPASTHNVIEEYNRSYKDFVNIVDNLSLDTLSAITRSALQEVQCLALNNYYEASTQGVLGMRAVTQVVLNRVLAQGFPGTACGVIYQKSDTLCQFSWTCARVLPKLDYQSSAWRDAVLTAQEAYKAGIVAPDLVSALFYHAASIKPKWKRVVKVKKVGDHIFYRKPAKIA